jgi:hypothetical protein
MVPVRVRVPVFNALSRQKESQRDLLEAQRSGPVTHSSVAAGATLRGMPDHGTDRTQSWTRTRTRSKQPV